MKYIRYLFLACLGVALIAVALANRNMVSLKLMPDGLSRIVGMNQTIDLPLFVVIFGGVVAGLLIGFVWEWLREHKHRVEVNRKAREVGKLEKEVKRLKGEKNKGKDEVLALLD
ncbi:MAG: lipopolysaccharide assembly protein LapA domain-containing protein [Pseudooceanicola atlanticus]